MPGITCTAQQRTVAGGGSNQGEQDIERTTVELTSDDWQGRGDARSRSLPAAEDFNNSKALQLAMELDPEGNRTIGVVTKIDNLPPGCTLVEKMSGEQMHLRHGYFAVRNRTQEEINNGVDLKALGEAEEALFQSDPVLSMLHGAARATTAEDL